MGAESTPQEYVDKMVLLFREVRRALREDGCFWLNLGDSYAGSATTKSRREGATRADGIVVADGHMRRNRNGVGSTDGYKPKDLMGIPWRVAFALQADGWYLRSACPWIKRNGMPESTSDRPTTSIESIFMFTKSERCYYDAEAVKVDAKAASAERYKYAFSGAPEGSVICPGDPDGQRTRPKGMKPYSGKRLRRASDWFFESWQGMLQDDEGDPLAFVVNTRPYKGAHFATFPPDLIRPCIQSSTPASGACPHCGAPYARIVEKHRKEGRPGLMVKAMDERGVTRTTAGLSCAAEYKRVDVQTLGWQQTCKCDPHDPIPSTVLDPFGGSGTTGQVALELGHNAILVELNPDYIPLIKQRCGVS